MLKIGVFSKICQVSIKTLRHWDSIDLLKPSYIDPLTSYRYYTVEQISAVNRILALKGMGLSLEQVGELLRDQPTTDDIRRLLQVRQMQIQQQIEEANAMLMIVEARLKQLEHGSVLPGYETVLKPVAPQPVAAVRRVLDNFEQMVDLLTETHALARQQDDPRLIAMFHDEAFDTEAIDVELAFPIDHPLPALLKDGQPLESKTLPGADLMATTIHIGEWLKLSQGYGYLGNWIAMNGYEIIGVAREIFHKIDWANDQKETVTEIQFPVRKITNAL